MLERGVLFRQRLGVDVDRLREEQVQQFLGLGQLVRGDAHINGHALFAQVFQTEIIGAGGRVQNRVQEDMQRFLEAADHRGKSLLGQRGEVGERGLAVAAQMRLLRQRT